MPQDSDRRCNVSRVTCSGCDDQVWWLDLCQSHLLSMNVACGVWLGDDGCNGCFGQPSARATQPSICRKLALTRWNPVPMNVLPMTSVSKFVTRFFPHIFDDNLKDIRCEEYSYLVPRTLTSLGWLRIRKVKGSTTRMQRFWIPNPSHFTETSHGCLSESSNSNAKPLTPRNQSGQLHKELISCMPSENLPSPLPIWQSDLCSGLVLCRRQYSDVHCHLCQSWRSLS